MIVPLNPQHYLSLFSSNSVIDRWLKINALNYQQIGRANTFVFVEENMVQGFYSAQSFNEHKEINGVLLVKLAVDTRYQHQGIGETLLLHAQENARQVAKLIGCQGIITYGKDSAIGFYEKYGFVKTDSATNELFWKVRKCEQA